MRETNNTLDFPSLSDDKLDFPSLSDDSTLQQLLLDAEGPDLDQSLAMPFDDTDDNILTCQDEPLQHNIIPKQFAEFSRLRDFSRSPDIFCNDKSTYIKALSCEEILKLARVRYMRASGNGGVDQAAQFAIPTLPSEEQEGMDLAYLLLSSADMISKQQYDQAARLLSQCKNFSSQLGKPTQRLAYYFSEALQERIERETNGELNKQQKPVFNFAYNVDSDFDKNELYALAAFYTQVFPYPKVLQFTSMQAIIDTVGNAEKIHVIDLGIRTGSQWTVLIQFLADRRAGSNFPSLQLLTITAVGMNDEELQNSGTRLHEFAKSLSVPFLYKTVKISRMEEIHRRLFDVKSDEDVAVYASIVLRSLLYDTLLLDKLLTDIKKLKPRIIVNEEVEGQHNSPYFLDRFIEIIFHFSTFFDSMEVVLADRISKAKCEEIFCGSQIRNMIACEGKARKVRHVKTDVWRYLFRQAGFYETSLSFHACYQARLLLNQFAPEKCYTLTRNGGGIVVGWKGTPLFALSVWNCKR